MLFESAPKLRLKLRLCLAALLLLLCIYPPSNTYAEDEWVKLKLNITVKDQNNNPVPGAAIYIPRPEEIKDPSKRATTHINEKTGPDGKVFRANSDFKLTGEPHELIITVPGSSQPLRTTLSDQDLRDAVTSGGELTREVIVTLDSPVKVSLNLTCVVKSKSTGKPVRNARVFMVPQAQKEAAPIAEAFTGADGKATLKNPALPLTGEPYKLIISASGFGQSEQELKDDELRDASTKGAVITRSVDLTEGEEPSLFRLIYEWGRDAFIWLINIVRFMLEILGLVFLVILILRVISYIRRKRTVGYSTVALIPAGPGENKAGEQVTDNKALQPIRDDKGPPEATQVLDSEILQQIRNDIIFLKKHLMLDIELRARLTSIELKIAKRNSPTGKRPVQQVESAQVRLEDAQVGLLPSTHEPHPFNEADGETAATGSEAEDASHESKPAEPGETDSFEPEVDEASQRSYKNLLRKLPPGTEPVYLNTEGASSAAGKLADDSVYLLQVGNTQGAFVLFTDEKDEREGWLYPNPTIALREEAVKEVFPKLTVHEFEASKEDIRPKRVSKVSERRWKFEPQR